MRRYPDATFRLAGNDEELVRYYNTGDVFVFPSLTDTFGLVMLEALACGVPVAAFPRRSRPASSGGMASAWMGVGSS